MEKLNGRAVACALIAVAGSAVIFFQRGSVDFGWHSFVLLVVASIAASESVIVSKRVGRLSPVVMNFIAMSAGAAALLVVSALAGESFALPEAGKTQIAALYLVAATVGLFLMVLVVVQRWTASSTSYIFVLMPDRRGRAGRTRRRREDHGDDDHRRRDRLGRGVSPRARTPRSHRDLLVAIRRSAVRGRHGSRLDRTRAVAASSPRSSSKSAARAVFPVLLPRPSSRVLPRSYLPCSTSVVFRQPPVRGLSPPKTTPPMRPCCARPFSLTRNPVV